MKLLKTIMILTVFCACKNTNSPETPKNTATEVDTLAEQQEQNVQDAILYTIVDKLRLRKTPGSKGQVLEQLKEGVPVIFMNEKTDYTEKIKLRDEWYEEPWLKIKSASGNIGWVFGGALTDMPPKEDISKTSYDDCEKNLVQSRNLERYHRCIEKIAAQELKAASKYIKATKDGYQVTLLSGETRNLVNSYGSEEDPDLRVYEYRHYLDKLGYFVFKIHRYEAGDYILMNDKFGYATPLAGMPRMSPDRKKILVTNADVDAGFEFNGIQLLEITDQGFQTVFEESMDNFAPHHPVWIDEKNIEFMLLSPEADQKRWKVKAKLSQDEQGEWALTINNRRE